MNAKKLTKRKSWNLRKRTASRAFSLMEKSTKSFGKDKAMKAFSWGWEYTYATILPGTALERKAQFPTTEVPLTILAGTALEKKAQFPTTELTLTIIAGTALEKKAKFPTKELPY
jgi:hypothetical protein